MKTIIPINHNNNHTEDHRFYLPHIGQRIIKTTIAVFICLSIYALRGFEGNTMRTEAAITAIICMQHDIQDTRRFAFNRFSGTLVGIFWGILLLLLLTAFPALGRDQLILFALMAAGVMLSLYTAVLLHVPAASNLAAIIFLCIVIYFPDIEAPFHNAAMRVLDILIGTLVAVFVNVFRLPRHKNREKVFFIHTKDLVPDQFAQISPSVLYRLNYLYNDGAKICMMSEHAPAFFAVQMNSVKFSMPLIVMDGAGVYDANENVYLMTENLSQSDSARLREKMDEMELSYFIYTVHKNRTCIFHRGEMCEEERTVYDRMKRSPYRNYLDGEVYHSSEIVYFKIIGNKDKIDRAQNGLQPILSEGNLRTKRRFQAGTKSIIALYIYSSQATKEKTRKKLMDLLWKTDSRLMPRELSLPGGCRSEHDALAVLHKLENEYEPVQFFNL